MVQNKMIEREIVRSWQRCRQLGVDKTTNGQFLLYENSEWNERAVKQTTLVSTFKKCFNEIEDLIPSGYIFLLTDNEGYLLSLETVILSSEMKHLSKWKLGTFFGEENCGTNAVDLALRLQKPVYFEPNFHYSDVFTDCYCYAIPLIRKEELRGCFALFSVEHQIQKEMICVAKLLVINMKKELDYFHGKSAFKGLLTKRQLRILELFAQGMTSQAIALELKLSENTIRYHCRRIFEILEAQSITEAVAKAAKMGCL